MIAWTPGIGDPTVLGWLTVVAYLAAAAICLAAGSAVLRRLSGPRPNVRLRLKTRRFWSLLALLLVLLAINKQLDLQTLFTDLARAAAHAGGWYADRRLYQAEFIGAVGVLGLVAIGLLGWLHRDAGRPVLLALAGMTALLVFVTVRAASFHHVDLLLASGAAGLRLNNLLELGGIAAVAVAGLWQRRLLRRRRRRSRRAVGAIPRLSG